MAEYESIHGTKVKYLTSDPTLTESSTEGQVWYNSTTGTNRALVQIKAWNSGGNLPTATNNNGSATQGTQTASLSFGGGNTEPQTIEYNGFVWTASNNLGTPRFVLSGAGVQTAALGFGGYRSGTFQTATEEYDGSSWTAGGALATARGSMGGNGTQIAALAVTGAPLSPGTQTEEYNGSSWTAGGNYPVAQQSIAIAGPQTAALGAGGVTGGPPNGSTVVTNYDGSSWTVVSGTIPNGQNRAAYAGTQTHAVVFGGNINTPPPAGPGTPGIVTTATNEWDGSTFTITANMATARQSYAGAGTATSAIGFAGDKNPGASNDTEEYNSNINAITQAVWASGGNMSTPKLNGGQGIGIKTAAAVFGGNQTSITYPYVNTTYEYDGSSWSGGGDMNNTGSAHGAFGTQTAGLALGSYRYPPNVSTTNVEEYNGSSWTAKPAMSVSRYGAGGAGTSTAGLAIGGTTKPPGGVISTVEHYDGEGWTGGGALPAARESMSSGGTQTAAIVAGGNAPPTYSDSLEYNGSAWTSTASLNNGGRMGNYGNGGPTAQTEMLVSGGGPGTITSAEVYNGTSWATTASLGTARNQHMNGQAGNTGTNGAIVAGGVAPPTGVNTSETFTDATSVATASTLTTS